MTPLRSIRRLLPALFAGLAAAALLPAADLRAQDTIPAPPDSTITVPIPGEAVRGDTIPDEAKPDSVPADSTRPAPNFPVFPRPRASGFSAASWVFGTAELSRFHGLTLLELLENIPGLVITHEGGVGRAAGVAAFASGGGRLRVFLDGWEMRPLNATVLDLQQVPLVDVTEVRVTRGLTETRVEVETLRLPDRRPYAQIEGGEGDFATRMLRGVFARPLGEKWMFHAGLDLVETAGFRRAADFSENTGLVRLGARDYEAGDYWLTNARLVFTPAEGNYELSLFGTNLTNEYNINSGFLHNIWQFDFGTVDRPREVGVAMRMFFN